MSLALGDSIFDPILVQFQKPHPFAADKLLLPAEQISKQLDDLESKFALNALTLVGDQVDKLVKNLKGADIATIDKAKFSIIPGLQQLTWFLWRDGWQLGQEHAARELSMSSTGMAAFAKDDDEPVIKVDASGVKRSQKLKVSKQLRNQAAVISDQGIPLENSVMRKAIEDRTLQLAKDVDEKTQKEIKSILKTAATPDPKTGKTISPKEVESRINLALGRQVNRARQGNAEIPRTKFDKPGGGFFSRAKLIARTELSGAYTTARLASFSAAGVTHVRWFSLEDLQRCLRCGSRHGMVVALSDVTTLAQNPIPLHPACRCLWQAVPNDEGGEKMRKDPNRSPGGRGIIPIAASWILGKALTMAGQPQTVVQEQKQDNRQLRNLIIGSGVGALSLAALYFLLLKNPQSQSEIAKNIQNATQNAVQNTVTNLKEKAIEKAAEIAAESVSIRPSISNNIDRYPNRYANRRTAKQVLSEETLESFPALATSDADLKNITIQELMRLTGLKRNDAVTFKSEILKWIRENELARSIPALAASTNPEGLSAKGVNLNAATIEQMVKLFGIPRDKAAKIRAYLDAGNTINNFDDLKKVPGISTSTSSKVAARVAGSRPNINTVPNTQAAATELAAQLGIGPKLAKAILDERDANGQYKNLENLTERVKKKLASDRQSTGGTYLGSGSVTKIASGAEIFAVPGIQKTSAVQTVGVGKEQPKLTPTNIKGILTPSPDAEPSVSPKSKNATLPTASDSSKLTPSILPSAPIGRNRVLPPSPEPPSSKLTQVDQSYQDLSNQIDNYHASVAANIPQKLRNRTQDSFNRQDQIKRRQSEIYTRASETASRLPDEVARIEQQVADTERAYQQFLNPLNEPYFETAPRNIKAINRQADNLSKQMQSIGKIEQSSLKQINDQIKELKALQSETMQAVNTPDAIAARNMLSSRTDELVTQASRLGDTPTRAQITAQINQLKQQLDITRNRSIAAIDNRIAELESLSANIRQDTAGVKQQIMNARLQLKLMRSRLNSVPKSTSELDDIAVQKYRQSRQLAASGQKTARKIAAYRELESQSNEQLQQVNQAHQQALSDYQLQHGSAVNNVSSIISRTQAAINEDMQLLRLMAGRDGINWVLSRSSAGDAALAVLQRQAGIKSITTLEEAAKFRDYALAQLHGQVAARIEKLQKNLDYPNQLAQNFLGTAKTSASDLAELQKRTVIESQERAASIIEDMDKWERGLATPLAGYKGQAVNPQAKQVKNQIIQEVTDRRIAHTQSINEAIADNKSWQSRLERDSSIDTIFEIEGKAITKSEILSQVQAINAEAQSLRNLRQVDVVPTQLPEDVAKKQAIQSYREQSGFIAQNIQEIQRKLGDINQQIRKRQDALNQGRKASSTNKLEAEKRLLESELSVLMQRVTDLDKNRGFSAYKLPVTNFNKFNKKPKLLMLK